MNKRSFNLLIALVVIALFFQIMTIYIIVCDINVKVDAIKISTDNIYNYCLE